MKIKYLFVEDNEELRNPVVDELRRSSSSTDVLIADSGETALVKLKKEPDIDLVVLDLSLSTDMYGMEVLSRIREFSNVPVVILSTDGAPERQTEALERGANGYMLKETFESPIHIRSHLEAILERSRASPRGFSDRYSFEGWILDAARRQLFNPDGAEVTLSSREFDLLLVFVENSQSVLAQQELIDKLRSGVGKDPQAALAKLLSRLRKKLDEDRRNSFILNVYGQGFHFTPTVTPADRA